MIGSSPEHDGLIGNTAHSKVAIICGMVARRGQSAAVNWQDFGMSRWRLGEKSTPTGCARKEGGGRLWRKLPWLRTYWDFAA